MGRLYSNRHLTPHQFLVVIGVIAVFFFTILSAAFNSGVNEQQKITNTKAATRQAKPTISPIRRMVTPTPQPVFTSPTPRSGFPSPTQPYVSPTPTIAPSSTPLDCPHTRSCGATGQGYQYCGSVTYSSTYRMCVYSNCGPCHE